MTTPPNARHLVDALAPAMRAAAALALDLEGRVPNRPKSGEASPVKAALTAADTAVQEALLTALHEISTNFELEAEEDTPSVASFSGEGPELVVIDPIDGTLRFFLEARGPYSILLGVATADVYHVAHIALPREGIFVEAVRGGGARIAVGDGPPAVAKARADGRRVFVSHDLPQAAIDSLREAGLEPEPASGGAISVAPLLPGVCGGLRYMPGGPVSVRGRVGALASREAGAEVCTSDGARFPENIRTHHATLLLAADPATLVHLRAAAAIAEAS